MIIFIAGNYWLSTIILRNKVVTSTFVRLDTNIFQLFLNIFRLYNSCVCVYGGCIQEVDILALCVFAYFLE